MYKFTVGDKLFCDGVCKAWGVVLPSEEVLLITEGYEDKSQFSVIRRSIPREAVLLSDEDNTPTPGSVRIALEAVRVAIS